MSNLVGFKVSGLKELQAQLVELGIETGVKALAQAARKSFEPVLAAAKAKAPALSGALRAGLKLTVKKPKGGGDTVVRVGIRITVVKDSGGGALLGKEEAPATRRWHFIEFGTAFMEAHPFLRPALDENAPVVLALLKIELRISIDKVLRKNAKAASANSWNTLGAFLG